MDRRKKNNQNTHSKEEGGMGMDKLKKNVICIVGFVVILLLLLMAVRSVKACQIVLRENAQAIEAAGNVLLNAESEEMTQEEYENLITQYGIMSVNPAQAINGISENLWIFNKYKLQHFENFILSGVAVPDEDMEQMKVIKQIQDNIEKASDALWYPDNGWLSLFGSGKRSATRYFAEIEKICKEWENKYCEDK